MSVEVASGGGGADVSAVTATSGDVRSGKKIVNANGEVVNGTKATKTSSDVYFATTVSGSRKVYVPSGIYDNTTEKIIPDSYEYVSKTLQTSDYELTPAAGNIGIKVYLPATLSQFSSDSVVNFHLKVNYAVTGGIRIHDFIVNTYTTQNGLKYYAVNAAWLENNIGVKDYYATDTKNGENAVVSDQYMEFEVSSIKGFDYENVVHVDGWLTVFNPISL